MEEARHSIDGFIEMICENICDHPDQLNIDIKSMATLTLKAIITCDNDAKKYLLGRGGKTISAVRTVIHSVAAKHGYKTYVSVI